MIEIPGYTIHSQLGVGGMATVYLATQDSLRRDVALKVMNKAQGSESHYEKRFIHEGHDLASLSHPNIATIYDISQSGDYYYYAMELLKGGSLEDRLTQGVSLVEAFKIIIQVGEALECAHTNNIVHRDLKPSNILFREYSTPVLTDFGIAKNINRDQHLTKTGALLGTPWYMSPEQCRGGAVDGRSDQYSLCILFYELITGQLPFDAEDSIAVAMKQVTEPVPQLPENLVALQPIINIAMDKDPEQRFTTVGEFCRVLNDMLGEDSLKGHMQHITQRIADGPYSTTGYRSSKTSASSIPDMSSANVPIPTEEEFWNEGSAFRKWFFRVLLFIAIGLGGYYYYQYHYLQQTVSETERFTPVLMRQAERQIALSQFLKPASNNAHETLMKVLAMDPTHQPALQMLDDIATTYEIRAREFLATEQLEKVRMEIDKGLMFSREHKGLLAVEKLLSDKLDEIEKEKVVKKKLAQVKQLFEKKSYLFPAKPNAMDEIRKVLVLEPSNASALDYKSQINELTENRLNNLLSQNKIDQASSELKFALEAFPHNEKMNSWRSQVDEVIKQRKINAEVRQLFKQGEQQLVSGQLVSPENSNALLSFEKIKKLAPENRNVDMHLGQLAALLNEKAKKHFANEQLSQALMTIENGLRAEPQHTDLLVLKAAVSERIRADENKTEQAFAKASSMLAQGKILLPEKDNAFLILKQILDKQPKHHAAKQLMASIPRRLKEQLMGLIRLKELNLVEQLYALSLQEYPKNEILTSLSDTIATFKREHKKEQGLAAAKEEIDRVVSNKNATPEDLLAAARLLNDVQKIGEGNPYVNEKLSDIVDMLESNFEQVESLLALDKVESILVAALTIDESHPDLANLNKSIINRREVLVAIEQARVDKLKLSIKINARPWGEIVRIIDAHGVEVELPDDRTTPLTLRLLPGDYQLVLTNPAYKKHKTLNLTVKAQDMPVIDYAFETLSAQRYFQAVNYK